jgi:hypothetical protein
MFPRAPCLDTLVVNAIFHSLVFMRLKFNRVNCNLIAFIFGAAARKQQ